MITTESWFSCTDQSVSQATMSRAITQASSSLKVSSIITLRTTSPSTKASYVWLARCYRNVSKETNCLWLSWSWNAFLRQASSMKVQGVKKKFPWKSSILNSRISLHKSSTWTPRKAIKCKECKTVLKKDWGSESSSTSSQSKFLYRVKMCNSYAAKNSERGQPTAPEVRSGLFLLILQPTQPARDAHL